MALYEILIIGSPENWQVKALTEQLSSMTAAFALAVPQDFAIRIGADVKNRNPKASAVALYFGGDPSIDVGLIDELEAAKVPIVPVVTEASSISTTVPLEIALTNACILQGDDGKLEGLAAVALEIIGLLHTQRRVFISYRRTESREVAIQLHDELTGRGFDVFLDTHDIRPGDAFQETLWHRLSDCDVTIMLDTKDYFSSRWTPQELGRSLALGIQVLRLVWPGHRGSRHLSLSDTIILAEDDLDSAKRLRPDLVSDIARRTETLRSRSIATRHLDLVGRLRSEVTRIGGKFEGIGAYRSMSITLPLGKQLEAYPLVGVPTAELLNDIHTKATGAGHGRFPCLVYNHVGIRPSWLAHLTWLDDQISTVRTLKVSDAGWELAQWET